MYPSFESVKELAETGKYKRIPVCEEMLSDRFTTIEVMRMLRAVSSHCYLLESAEAHQQWGRYSFLGYAPTMEITCRAGRVKIRKGEDIGEEEIRQEPPQKVIREILEANKSPKMEGMPAFTGGLVGYFSYDYICYSEPSLHFNSEDPDSFQDVDLMLFDKVIVFDHYRQKVMVICGVEADRVEASYQEAEGKLQEMEELLKSNARAYFPPVHLKEEIRPCFSRERYTEMVEKAKHYIREGDIFQVVLSNPMEAKAEGSLFDVYRILRSSNPSPYMFYFSSDDMELVGASPETLVKLEDGRLHTFPLAGTRPRGQTQAEDAALEAELLADEKELAEHNMLVDLGRNDLGKISKFGSVQVEKLHSIERFSHVMHIGSTVRGEIRDDRDALDAIEAVLPAGTLSGAPKIRACQLIGALENNKRGIYGGAIGYIDFTGNMDTCIAIRIAYKKNGRVFVRSGAGIVADSVPEKEYTECLNKARSSLKALELAQEADE